MFVFFTQQLSYSFSKVEPVFFPSLFRSSLPFAHLVQRILSKHLFTAFYPHVLKRLYKYTYSKNFKEQRVLQGPTEQIDKKAIK